MQNQMQALIAPSLSHPIRQTTVERRVAKELLDQVVAHVCIAQKLLGPSQALREGGWSRLSAGRFRTKPAQVFNLREARDVLPPDR